MLEIINIPRSPDVSFEHHPDTMAALITVKFLKAKLTFVTLGRGQKEQQFKRGIKYSHYQKRKEASNHQGKEEMWITKKVFVWGRQQSLPTHTIIKTNHDFMYCIFVV